MTKAFVRALAAIGALLLAASPASAQQAVGAWNGRLTVGAMSLRIGVEVTRGADGTLSGTMSSPDQGAAGIPLSAVTLAGTHFSFEAPSIRGRYQAEWDAAQGGWAGTWTQGQALPLVLRPGAVAAPARPQAPKPPFPYSEEEVAIDAAAGVRLACTFTRPRGTGPVPAVFLVSGSGPQDRDEALAGHRPFAVLADHLTRAGIAVLRCDDRGFDRSTGDFATSVTQDYAADAIAVLAWLRRQQGIGKVGLVGHSEGGVVGPMVAARDPKLAFLALLAAPGIPMADLLVAQAEAVARSIGMPAERAAQEGQVTRRVIEAVAGAPSAEAARAAASRTLAEAGAGSEAIANQSAMVATPWFRGIAAYDPRPALAALRLPVLAINGATDTQVLAGPNLAGIREATRGNADVTIVELPGLNHLLQTSASGAPTAYAATEETMSPSALNLIAEWILKRR
ncbi:alpha/beta hydrolase family protein [Sphingomonas parva]|nr:alpha/beta hydrolase [Sphingomonas parva]